MKRAIILLGACALAAAAASTTVMTGCSKGDGLSGDASSSGNGGGSMARFTIAGDWLYTVHDSQLKVVSLKNPDEPVWVDDMNLGWGIETIFTMKELLFIGSQTGMYIYDISNPEFPQWKSTTTHFKSCDPVVAWENLAFVTLNSSTGTWCGMRGDVLQVYDITNLGSPVRLAELGLNSPRGLAVDGEQKLVFVCEGDKGIVAIDITDPASPRPRFSSITPAGGRFDAYDCILLGNNRLLAIGSDGLFQLDYDPDPEKGCFTLVSKIDIREEE
jgi:hypothetical protein